MDLSAQFRIDKAPCYRIDKILPSYRIPTDESFIRELRSFSRNSLKYLAE
ncbi:hypothetical protein HMPREF1554_00150 [Porphyromonas gingivalis F0569]|nr:hypothetical protein HMPREF1554_00150 [Porphyromonas gingivalis F0569]ERJ82000.1 hypothetical protein HMPREF1988_01781 [Porphyromonas gingivalis F0185]